MALSKPTKQFSDDDLITCGICHIEMEHPRSLLCLHTYCLGCLREWSKRSKNEVICPVCREPTPLPADGVDGLRNNFFVTKLKDRKAVSRQLMDKDVKIACTSCDVSDGNEAVARCLECDDFLCDSCFKGHKSFRLTKNHSVYTLVDLRSGEVQLTKKTEVEHCKEHAGQVLWFYCKTCDMPICRDCTVVEHPSSSHELIKITEAITGQREEIKKLAETCKIVEKKVEEAFKQYDPMSENINSSCNAVCMAIDERKDEVQKSLLKSLEKQADDLKVTVAGMKSVREKAASAYGEELQMLNTRLKTALDMASHVTRDGSDCDVASVYKHLTTTLQQLGQIKIPSIDLGNVCFQEESSLNTSVGCIGRIQETEIRHPTQGRSFRMQNKKQWNAPWKMVRKFGDTGKGKLRDARGVAINQDGAVAVADYAASKVYVYDIENGDLKMSIDTEKRPINVVPYQGYYIVSCDNANSLQSYDNKGKYIRQIVLSNTKFTTAGFAVNSESHILVGNNANSIQIYRYADGKQIASLDTPISADYIAVSQSDDKFVISASSEGAQVIDSQGHTIHVLRPPSDVTSYWFPTGVCTIGEGDEEEIFICQYRRPSGIYRFSLTTGKYLGCITTEVSDPHGMAFTEDGRLVVAERTLVKLFTPAE